MFGQPIKQFPPNPDIIYRILEQTPTDEVDIMLQPGQEIVILAQSREFTLINPVEAKFNYFIDSETLVGPLE